MNKIKLNKGWTVDRLVQLIEKHVPDDKWGCRLADNAGTPCLYHRSSDDSRCGVGALMPDEAIERIGELQFPIHELDPGKCIENSCTYRVAIRARRVFEEIKWDMPTTWDELSELQSIHDSAYDDLRGRTARQCVIDHVIERFKDGDPA